MDINKRKQELRNYIAEKVVYSIPLRVGKGVATLLGIAGGAKAVEKGTDILIKAKERKLKKKRDESYPTSSKLYQTFKYAKKAGKYYKSAKKKGEQLASGLEEDKKEVIKGLWKHKGMLGKAFRRAAIAAGTWTAGEKIISTAAAVKKQKEQIRKLAKISAEKEAQKKKSS